MQAIRYEVTSRIAARRRRKSAAVARSKEPTTPDGKDRISELPDEILLHVFRYIDQEDLVLNVQHVSERWARVAQDVTLWKDFTYSPRRNNYTRQVVRVLCQSPQLRSFTMYSSMDANLLLDVLCNRCKELRTLKIEVSTGLNIRVLKGLFTRIPALENLQISQKPLVPGGTYKRLSLKLKPSSDIHKDMSYFYESLNMGFTKHPYMAVVKFILRHKRDNIEQLELNFVTDEMLKFVMECKNLKKLSLKFDQYQDTLKTDLQFLREFDSLESLGLINYHNDSVLNELFSKEPMDNIKELNLSWCTEVSDRTMRNIQKNCVNLEKISVECCLNLTDRGIQHLSKCEMLSHIKMSSCSNLTAESIRTLTRSRQIKQLDLRNFLPPVRDYLPYIISSHQLEQLDLKGCIITREDIRSLVSNLRYTKFIIDPPTNN